MAIKRFIYVLLLLLRVTHTEAQQPDVDILGHEIETAKNDTIKIVLFHAIIEAYAETMPDSSVYFAEQLLSLARKLNYKLDEIFALAQIGYGYVNMGNYPRSLKTLLAARAIAENPKSEQNILPDKYLNPKEFLRHPISADMRRLGLLARVHQILGVLYSNNYDYLKSLSHHLEAIQLAEKTGHVRALCETNLTLGRLYLLSFKKPDSALLYEQRAYDVCMQSGYVKYVGSILLNLGRIQLYLGNKQLATEYFRRAIYENTKQNYLRGVAAGNLWLADLYMQAGSDSSRYFAISALRLAKYLNFPDLLLRSYTALASFYRYTNNKDSTVKYQELIIKMNDSLFSLKQIQQFQNIDLEEERRQQEQAQQQQQLQNKVKFYSLLAALVVFLVIAFLLYRNGHNKQKANTLLAQEKEKVESTLAQVKTLQAQLIETEKMNERLRISRELHDDVGSTLSGIVLYSHLAENQIQAQHTDEVEQSLNIIQQSANDMVSKLNDIVWAVNPEHNSLKNLMQKLEEYATEMAMAKNIKVLLNADESLVNLQLPVETLHNIYLLCKEAINNAVKYSHAPSLELSAQHFDNVIELTIRDNGKGFDIAAVKKGNGLMNMQKRADEIGAKLCLRSVPLQGTVISLQCSIEIPEHKIT